MTEPVVLPEIEVNPEGTPKKPPPPPAGFDSVSATPPPAPPGFQVVPPDPPKGFSLVEQALKPITTYLPTEARIAKESADTVKQGLSDLVPHALGGPEGKTASGLWDTATGAARYVGAPIEAGLETVVGKPIEENTGIPSEWTKFAAGLAIPYYGLRGSPAATTAKKIFTPENVSPQAQEAAGIIRGTQGTAARDTASSMEAVKQYHPIVNALSEPERMDFFKYMEGRSKEFSDKPTDTRNAGTQYHGSNENFISPSSNHYSTKNYYGQGFYTTDAADIAKGYAENRSKKGGSPNVFEIKENRPLKIIDAEQPISGGFLKNITGDLKDYSSGDDVIAVAVGEKPKNIRELYDKIREIGTGDGMSADSVQEIFDSINYHLRQMGYDGLSHQGGLLTKKSPHKVVIYFNPEKDVSLVKRSFNDFETKGKPFPEKLKAVADELKKGFEKRRMDLQSLDSKAEMNFVQDYFPHMWKDPKKAQDFLSQFGGKEGSGRNLKARTIPTIEDGINAGLELKTTNPLDAYQAYITNMDRFIATERAFEKGRETGSVKYFSPGSQPSGWVEVKSRLGNKIAAWTEGDPVKAVAIPKVAYAPEDWARIYNNFTSRGAAELGPEFGSAYEAARMASNAVTALELSLSGYHALTMAQEGTVNEVSRAIQQGARGSLLKSAATAAKSPLAPLLLAMKGSKAQKVYLNSTPGSKEMRDVVDILTEAGARLTGRAHAADLGSSAAGSFFDAWKKGSLKTELKADWRDWSGKPVRTTASAVARNIGRAMDTVMHPLFQTYIPKLKAGAAYENMADWLKANPKATKPEQLAMARQIVDSIDNRFGEMIQDNIFWNKTLKQSAIVGMRSYSWNLGTVREIAGGVTDVLAGKGLTQRAAYNIALPIVYGMTGAAYQYLKTGQGPQNVQDYLAPRTGGTDPRSGLPERITPPGYMKDVIGWATDPRQEAINKVATAPRLAGEILFKGTDWRDDPIAPPGDPNKPMPDNVPTWLKAYFEHVAEALGPISIKNTAKGPKKGSNLSAFERVLGIQPGGMSKSDPEGFANMMQKINERKWKNKLRHDETQKNQYGGPSD